MWLEGLNDRRTSQSKNFCNQNSLGQQDPEK